MNTKKVSFNLTTKKLNQKPEHTDLKNPLSIKGKKALLFILTLLVSLLKKSHQQCVETFINGGHGVVRGKKLASNNTLMTIDHWIVHRVLSLESHKILHEIDLKPFFSKAGHEERFIKAGFYYNEKILFMMTEKKIYRFNFENDTITHIKDSSSSIISSHFLDLAPRSTKFSAVFTKDFIQIFSLTETEMEEFCSWEETSPTDPSKINYRKLSSSISLAISPSVRIYATIFPNKIGFIWISEEEINGKNYGIEVITEIASLTNITSNIAVKESQDVIAYGVNSTRIIETAENQKGGVRFRQMDLTDRFYQELDYPFFQTKFSPFTNHLLIYDKQGLLCLLAYDITGGIMTVESCFAVAAPDYEIEFMTTGKILLFKESTIAVYNFPSVSFSHVYSPQPLFMDQVPGEKNQIHVFPGFKIRIFNTDTLSYETGNFFEGNVYRANFNPHNKYEIFVLVDLKKILRIHFPDGIVINTFTSGAENYCTGGNCRNPRTVGFDFSKLDSDIFYTYNMATNVISDRNLMIFGQFQTTSGSLLKTSIRIEDTFYKDNMKIYKTSATEEEFVVSGPGEIMFFSNILGSTRAKINHAMTYNPSINLIILDNGNTILSFSETELFAYNQATSSRFSFYWSNPNYRIYSSLLEIMPEDPETGTPRTIFAGGNKLLRLCETDQKFTFNIDLKNEITGVIFKDPQGSVYLQQTEKTRVKYTGGSKPCFANENQDDYLTDPKSCSVPNCDQCNLETSTSCVKCQSPYLLLQASCVGSCPSGFYNYKGKCEKHCPLYFFKHNGECVSECGTGFWKLGDYCSLCDGESQVKSGKECKCKENQILNEDGSCVANNGGFKPCLPGLFWHHYRMCIGSVRNETEYKVYGGTNVYCDSEHFVDYEGGFKCVRECLSPKSSFSHDDYGKLCVSEEECKSKLFFYFDISNQTCVKICSSLSNELLVPSTSECVSSCPETGSNFLLEGNKSCETSQSCTNAKIPSQHYTFNSEKNFCVLQCPENHYKLKTEFSCLTAEECQSLEEFYTLNKTGECVTHQECLNASMTVSNYSKDCFLLYVPSKIATITIQSIIGLSKTATVFIPLIVPIFSKLPSSKLLAYIGQSSKKLELFSYFSFRMTEISDAWYLKIFGELEGELNKFLIELFKKELKQEDQENICKKKYWRFCHIQTNSSVLITQTFLFFIFFLLITSWGIFSLIGLCSKKSAQMAHNLRHHSLPNFWLGNQLQLIFSLIFNVLIPLLSNWFFKIGFILSIILGILIFGGIVIIAVFKKGINSKYFKITMSENMIDVFKYKRQGFYFTKLTFVFDTLMSLVIVLFEFYPAGQTLIWILLQSTYLYLIFTTVEFKEFAFTLRLKITETIFLLLSSLIFFSSLDQENESYFLSWAIFSLSGVNLLVNLVFAVYVSGREMKNCCCRKIKKKKKLSQIRPVYTNRSQLESERGLNQRKIAENRKIMLRDERNRKKKQSVKKAENSRKSNFFLLFLIKKKVTASDVTNKTKGQSREKLPIIDNGRRRISKYHARNKSQSKKNLELILGMSKKAKNLGSKSKFQKRGVSPKKEKESKDEWKDLEIKKNADQWEGLDEEKFKANKRPQRRIRKGQHWRRERIENMQKNLKE